MRTNTIHFRDTAYIPRNMNIRLKLRRQHDSPEHNCVGATGGKGPGRRLEMDVCWGRPADHEDYCIRTGLERNAIVGKLYIGTFFQTTKNFYL